MGRGATRGDRRELYDLVNTKPEELATKCGTEGTVVPIVSNYIKFATAPDYRLNQYRVDFKPDEEVTRIKKGIVYRARNQLPKYLFDGSVMMTVEEIFPHKQQKEKVITGSRIRDDKEEPVEVTIKLVGEIHKTDHHYIHVRFELLIYMTTLGNFLLF